MNYLFVHQGFPGQYIHIIERLAKEQNNIVAMGLNNRSEVIPKKVKYMKYTISRGNNEGLHPWMTDMETKVLRGEACAKQANILYKQGFMPDIICGHPGWGELLFLSDIWKNCPILSYQEFFYQPEGFDTGFDKEFGMHNKWTDRARSRMKGANCLLNLDLSEWNITPTEFQKSSFPTGWHNKISVIHDGINTEFAAPNKKRKIIDINETKKIREEDNLITFVNRSIEPYRGCHTFIRSIPEIQDKVENSQIVIVGSTTGVSYGAQCERGEWKDVFLKEIEGCYDKSRVHFVGKIRYESLIGLLQRTDAHVYLTYPFVLSWSLLEAMSCGAPVIASSTAPVMEVITNGVNGLLTDFFDSRLLAEKISIICKQKTLAYELGEKARTTIENRYELANCVKSQIELIHLVAKGAIG